MHNYALFAIEKHSEGKIIASSQKKAQDIARELVGQHTGNDVNTDITTEQVATLSEQATQIFMRK